MIIIWMSSLFFSHDIIFLIDHEGEDIPYMKAEVTDEIILSLNKFLTNIDMKFFGEVCIIPLSSIENSNTTKSDLILIASRTENKECCCNLIILMRTNDHYSLLYNRSIPDKFILDFCKIMFYRDKR